MVVKEDPCPAVWESRSMLTLRVLGNINSLPHQAIKAASESLISGRHAFQKLCGFCCCCEVKIAIWCSHICQPGAPFPSWGWKEAFQTDGASLLSVLLVSTCFSFLLIVWYVVLQQPWRPNACLKIITMETIIKRQQCLAIYLSPPSLSLSFCLSS